MTQPFPFIVGCVRSGTTLLRAMLERHPRMATPPESYFPVSLAPSHDRHPIDTEGLLRDLMSNRRFRDWEMDEPSTRAALEGATDYPSAIRGLYAAYAGSRDRDLYGDKT